MCGVGDARTYIKSRIGNKSFTSRDTRRERIFMVQGDRGSRPCSAPFLFDKIHLNRASPASRYRLSPSFSSLLYREKYIAIGLANRDTEDKRDEGREGTVDTKAMETARLRACGCVCVWRAVAPRPESSPRNFLLDWKFSRRRFRAGPTSYPRRRRRNKYPSDGPGAKKMDQLSVADKIECSRGECV